MIKYFTIEDLLKHYLQKKFHILVFTDSSFLRGERLSILERTFGASDDCNDHLRAFLQR